MYRTSLILAFGMVALMSNCKRRVFGESQAFGQEGNTQQSQVGTLEADAQAVGNPQVFRESISCISDAGVKVTSFYGLYPKGGFQPDLITVQVPSLGSKGDGPVTAFAHPAAKSAVEERATGKVTRVQAVAPGITWEFTVAPAVIAGTLRFEGVTYIFEQKHCKDIW